MSVETHVADLHVLLIPRIQALREYVASQIPPRLRPLVAPDDVLQEVWLTVRGTAAEVRDRNPDAIDAWLRAIARNRLIDVLRSARLARNGGRFRRVLPTSATPAADPCDHLRGRERTPSRAAHAHEAGRRVSTLLTALTEERRWAVSLCYLEGRSLEDAARIMGKTPHAVHSLLFHALRQLRALFGPAAAWFTDARTAAPAGMAPPGRDAASGRGGAGP
ncbi:MAG: RNA polymerase sigma factor [Planctomycetota bacterium]